jgi:IS30 family transposase
MDTAQRRPVVAALREEGHSHRAIAAALGISKKTVQNDLETSQVDTPIHVAGQDGKSYPARRLERDKSHAPASLKRGERADKRAAYDAGANKHSRRLANAQRG